MPSDLILPAFAITLLANAVLIVLAIRMFMTERPGPRRDADSQTTPDPAAKPSPPVTVAPERPVPEGDLPVPTTVSAVAVAEPSAMKPESTSAMANNTTTAVSRPAKRRRRQRRERFSIPALEEDHERFNQSIADLLSGGSRKPRDPE